MTATLELVPGQIYRIHIPSMKRTGLVKARIWQGELCTERVTGDVEPVRCESVDTNFVPATPEECAEFQERSRW